MYRGQLSGHEATLWANVDGVLDLLFKQYLQGINAFSNRCLGVVDLSSF